VGQTIIINWQMFDPPIAAKSWKTWTQSDFAESSVSPIKNETMLTQTVELALQQALKERLPRSTGWLIEQSLNTPTKEALKIAAQIYKRGVSQSVTKSATAPRILSGSYPIEISDASTSIINAINDDNFLVVDHNVYNYHKALFENREDALVLQLDEHSKNLTTVRNIINAWNQTKKSKTWCLVGGGILTDTAAFAASLCQCDSEFIPTTLLAIADACVGGKTGVNSENYGKNLVGRFYFPRRVLAWSGWLASLDQRQLDAGAFECLKHFLLINDLKSAAAFAQTVVQKDLTSIAARLPNIIKVKADVVEKDPAETGQRAILNLGHTLGHAVEGVSQKFTAGQNTILHGEAVGVGMMFAAFLSTKISGLSVSDADARIGILKQVSKVNAKTKLKTFFGDKEPASPEIINELQRFITQDKKATDNSPEQSHWILFNGKGEVKGPTPKSWTYSLDMPSFPSLWLEFLKNYC
jgi:3-dehydroquinate synthetase